MSGSNYEYCPICNTKALYVGEGDAKGCVVLHQRCYDMIRKPTANDRAVERIKVLCAAASDDYDEWRLAAAIDDIIREEAERNE